MTQSYAARVARSLVVGAMLLLSAACSGDNPLPNPTITTPTIAPPPSPTAPALIVVGQPVSGTILPTDPQCGYFLLESHGPCQVFQTVAPGDGRLVIEATWPNPQYHLVLQVVGPTQGREAGGDSPAKVTSEPVRAGTSLRIWVVLDRVDGPDASASQSFQLTTSLAP